MAKSPEEISAAAIVKALDKKVINTRLIAWFIMKTSDWGVLLELLEVTLHVVKQISNSELGEHVSVEKARIWVLCDSIVRAVEESGHKFN
jgi:DNA-binding IscR family transcriptional regulator